MAMQFVSQCNEFTRQKAGGWKPAPSLPKVFGHSCLMCVTRGTCLGSGCFGDKGRCFSPNFNFYFSILNVSVLTKVNEKPADQKNSFEFTNGTIPGLQASHVHGSRVRNSKKSTKQSRLVLC